nr:trna (guanine-n(7)-)-methyltransferase [Quercus suber]
MGLRKECMLKESGFLCLMISVLAFPILCFLGWQSTYRYLAMESEGTDQVARNMEKQQKCKVGLAVASSFSAFSLASRTFHENHIPCTRRAHRVQHCPNISSPSVDVVQETWRSNIKYICKIRPGRSDRVLLLRKQKRSQSSVPEQRPDIANMAGPPKKKQRRSDHRATEEGELPQKKYYRQRAHANPFSDHDLV